MMQSAQKKTYFDPNLKENCVNLLPGEFYATDRDEVITTILGSCIAACVRDVSKAIGGMNHFLLAQPQEGISSPSARYGSYAMECLINDILRRGGHKNDLEIKIFGGADLLKSSIRIGQKNCDFILNYLKNEGFRLAAQDIGGDRPRRIHYWPKTGRLIRVVLNKHDEEKITAIERNYSQSINKVKDPSGDIELF